MGALSKIAKDEANALVQANGIDKALSIQSHNLYTAAHTQFMGYVGRDGKASSAPSRYRLSVNAMLKKAFGMAKENMSTDMLRHVTYLERDLAAVMDDMMARGEPRDAIKRVTKTMIRTSAESYQYMQHAKAHALSQVDEVGGNE